MQNKNRVLAKIILGTKYACNADDYAPNKIQKEAKANSSILGGLQLDTTNKGSRPEIQAETRGGQRRFNCRIFERRVDRRDTTNKGLLLQPFEMPPEKQQIERRM